MMNHLKKSTEDLTGRLPVWRALTNLFLDTKIDGNELVSIANVCASSSYSIENLNSILFKEVFPAFESNLIAVYGGEWCGWTDDEIVEKIQAADNFFSRIRWANPIYFPVYFPRYFEIKHEISELWKQIKNKIIEIRSTSITKI